MIGCMESPHIASVLLKLGVLAIFGRGLSLEGRARARCFDLKCVFRGGCDRPNSNSKDHTGQFQ